MHACMYAGYVRYARYGKYNYKACNCYAVKELN